MTKEIEIRKGHLFFDGCDTVELAKEYGTPVYLLSGSDIEKRISDIKRDFIDKYPDLHNRAAYASKAFASTGLYRLLDHAGLSIDVVSGGELYLARKAHFPADRIEMNGNNKSEKEIDEAVSYGVGRIIVDGLKEVPLIEAACKKYQKRMKVMVRITPGVAASTHDYIVTGKKDSKFGIPPVEEVLLPIIKEIIDSPYVEFMGLHMHVGSQLFETDAYLASLDVLMDWAGRIYDKYGAAVREVNFGGGFGAVYTDEERKPYSFFLDPLMEKLKKRSAEIGIPCPNAVIEPGRSLIAEAGMTLYTVGQIKEIPGIRTYVSVDGGMGDNIRVALYQAKYTGTVANRAGEEAIVPVTVCGKYCESGDILMKDFLVPRGLKAGDIIATYSTGAYGYSMASRYNANPIPGVLYLKKGKAAWLIRPETYEDLDRGMEIPDLI